MTNRPDKEYELFDEEFSWEKNGYRLFKNAGEDARPYLKAYIKANFVSRSRIVEELKKMKTDHARLHSTIDCDLVRLTTSPPASA